MRDADDAPSQCEGALEAWARGSPGASETGRYQLEREDPEVQDTPEQAAEARRVAAEMAELDIFSSGDMKLKLTHKVFGPDGGWSEEFADTACKEYCRFMARKSRARGQRGAA